MRIGPRGTSLWMVVLAAGLVPTPARAQVNEGARVAEAERACLEGNYQKGVELLAALYLDSRHPAYLHNQARCYEQNGQYQLAAGRYREFLRKLRELPPEAVTAETQLTPEKVAALEGHATRLEQMGPARRPGAAPVTGDGNSLASKPEPPPPAAATVQRVPEPTPAGNAGAGARVAGTVLMVAGALGLAGSAGAGLLARRAEQNISEASRRGGATFDAAQYRNGERAARIATIGFAAAPVVAVAGAIIYWRGASRRNESRSSLRVLPAVARESFGATLAFSY